MDLTSPFHPQSCGTLVLSQVPSCTGSSHAHSINLIHRPPLPYPSFFLHSPSSPNPSFSPGTSLRPFIAPSPTALLTEEGRYGFSVPYRRATALSCGQPARAFGLWSSVWRQHQCQKWLLPRPRAGPSLATQADGTCSRAGAGQEHVDTQVFMHWGLM